MHVSVADARSRLSALLRRVKEQPVTITRRGDPVGVLISPEEYEELAEVRAYLRMLRLSESLEESGMSAEELLRASRAELEERQ